MADPGDNDPIIEEDAPGNNDPIIPDVEMLSQPTAEHPGGMLNAFRAGLQASSAGLALRGTAPDIEMSGDAPWYERAAGGVGGLVGDVPAMIVGGVAGTAVSPGIGTAAGAFAVPMGIREALMQSYEQGGANSWEDVWSIIKAGGIGTAEGAVIGAATGGAGRLAGAALDTAAVAGHVGRVGVVTAAGPGVAASALARIPAVAAAEVTAMTTAGAALEGRMPTAQDFLDAAILVGGLHAIKPTVKALHNIYSKTGVKPAEVALAAVKDPALKTEILAGAEVPEILKPLAAKENAKAAVSDPKEMSPEARARAEQFMASPFAEIPQAPGAPKLRGHVNYEYINGREDLGPIYARIEELNADLISAKVGGTKSQNQTIDGAKQALADKLGVKTQDLPYDVQVAARDMVMGGVVDQLKIRAKELTELGTRATPEQTTSFLALVEKAGMIAADNLGKDAELGRAMAIKKRSARERIPQRELMEVIDSYKGGEDGVFTLARILGETDTHASVLRAVKEATKATRLEKAIEIFKASIFSGPTTWQANFYGNVISSSFAIIDRTVGVGVSKVRGGGGLEMHDVALHLDGLSAGIHDGFKAFGHTLIGKVAPTNAKGEQYRQAVGGLPGKVVQVPFRILSATDALFRIPNERAEGYRLAGRDALDKGLVRGTREYNEHVVDFVQNPSTATEAAMRAAGDQALFTTQLGPRMRKFKESIRGTGWEFIVPVITTPANLMKWSAQYIPGAHKLLQKARADTAGENGRVAQDLAYARLAIGTVILNAVAVGALKGVVTGGMQAEPEKRKTFLAAGGQLYSVKLGDKYYSYARLDPLARVISTAADTIEIYNASEEDDKINMMAVMVAAIGNATISQGYLSGMARAVQSITEPHRYAGQFLEQYAASLVPSILGQPAVAIDPQTREINSIFDAMQGRLPILREQLLAKRNPLTGEEVDAPGQGYIASPVKSTIASDDRVLTEANRLGISLSGPPNKVHVGRGTGKTGDVKISPEQRNAFTQAQGEFTHQQMSPMVNSPDWDSIPDIAKARIYKKVISAARQQAALVALPPEAREAEALRIGQEMADKFAQ